MNRMMKYLPSLLPGLLSVVVLVSCSERDPGPSRVLLIDTELVQTRTASDLQTFMSASAIDVDPAVLKYDIELYKVSYKTEYKGTEINASGLVILPKTTDPVGMLSFQHGTTVAYDDAPTNQMPNSTSYVLYGAIGSAGFVGVIPDFIGFGESQEIFHPYYVEETTARAVVDNLIAAREFAAEKNINFNKKLFLAGYSQGGYATMAAHKLLETGSNPDFNLVASFPAAGGYDVKGVQEYFFEQENYDDPYYLAYVAFAYQSYYEWPNTLDDFFNEPYASRIPGLFNGINSAGSINSQLTKYIPDLIKEDFRLHIDVDEQYSQITNAFEENSLLDWSPETKMYLYHGDADVTVPFQNSVDTYNHFISTGSSTDVVTMITLPGSTHSTGIVPYLEDMIDKVIALK